MGIVPLAEALTAAQEASLDLVQIADSDPVVCKIMDYGKHVFAKKKSISSSKGKIKRTLDYCHGVLVFIGLVSDRFTHLGKPRCDKPVSDLPGKYKHTMTVT